MKKFHLLAAAPAAAVLLALLVPLMALFVPPTAAAAEAGEEAGASETPAYARIEQDGTYLYRSPNAGAGLFVLPQSYFVRLTGEAGDYYTVEYLSGTAGRTAVYGYCLRSQVTPVDYLPETPYLCYAVDVTFRTDGDAGLPTGFITDYTVSAPYYGSFRFGSSTYYYVELNGAFGYVPATACSALDYPLNTEHTEAPVEQQPPAEEEPAPEGGLGTLGIVLLCVLGAAGLGLLYFLFRPAHKKRSASREGETEEFYG